MRSLFEVYESITDSDEQVVKSTVLTAYGEKIMSTCGCTPESEFDIIDNKLYIVLRYSRNDYEIYTHLFGSRTSYSVLKDILKSTDIYYVVTNRLVLSGTGGSKGSDWENNINNILDLFENKRWHFVDANHKEIRGKFEVSYVENSYFKEGSRDYKRLCDWLKKRSTKDIRIKIHGSHNDGDISVSNIDCNNIVVGYMSENCTFTNCKADVLKIGGGEYTNSFIGRCFFKNTKFNKIDVYSDDSSLLSKLYFMLSGIKDVEDLINRKYGLSETKVSLVKRCLKDDYDVIKKNLQAIGNPEITINVTKQRGPGHFTFKLQENNGKYILNSI